MRKIILIMLVCILVLNNSVTAVDMELMDKEVLSEMSDAALMDFVEEAGIVPPAHITDMDGLADWTRGMVSQIEQNPDCVFLCTGPNLVYAEEVRTAVLEYYGDVLNQNAVGTYSLPGASSLQQSDALASTWSDSYYYYRCYAYAIVRTYGTYCPGQIAAGYMNSSYYAYDYNTSPALAASRVVSDLEYLGYDARYTTTRPTSLDASETLICVRVSTTNGQFHFMRYNSINGKWQHKPGTSVPLRFRSTPSNSIGWIVEGVLKYDGSSETVYECDTSYTYNSTIYYVVFSDPNYYDNNSVTQPGNPGVEVNFTA